MTRPKEKPKDLFKEPGTPEASTCTSHTPVFAVVSAVAAFVPSILVYLSVKEEKIGKKEKTDK